ncbi:NAD-dependent epimerase/dehydratase family protein [Pacificibacter maritimus]|nr:NAD-dependent epimerase/dehydratase family protein [Pacificibacter maritimus]
MSALNTNIDTPPKYIFLGASGRIGRLLTALYAEAAAPPVELFWQVRRRKSDLKNQFLWSDFKEAAPLIDCAKSVGGIDGLFVFSSPAADISRAPSHTLSLTVSLVEQAIIAAKSARIPRVVVASSSAVYGAGCGVPFMESDPLEPVNPYGQAKRDMELRARELAQKLGIELCLLRIGNVAGADALLGAAGQRTADDEPVSLDIYPDGAGPRRSYIGPERLLEALCDLAMHRAMLPTVLNIAAQRPVSMNALLDAAQIPWVARHVPASPKQDIVLNCEALAQLSGGAPSDSAADEIISQWHKALSAT